RERFLPADCVTARRNEARCIGAGESRGDYALACFIFRILRRPQEALRQATDANARSYTHEEVMQAMQERIDRARDKPC
ncbi:hypothetical protein ACV8TE_26870, partial [Citrobacter portucalensis]